MDIVSHLEQLKIKHRELDNRIIELAGLRGTGDEVRRLKTQKLWIKDEIHRIETQRLEERTNGNG